MDHLVDQLFVFEGDGKIKLFNGNYSDYRSWLEENEEQTPAEPAKIVEPVKIETETRRKPSFKEKQEYEKLQGEIEALEKKKDTIALSFSSGTTDHLQLQKWTQEIQELTKAIEEKTARWMELAELIGV
jgi:ATP-binding cassette subfamily F protein uup